MTLGQVGAEVAIEWLTTNEGSWLRQDENFEVEDVFSPECLNLLAVT